MYLSLADLGGAPDVRAPPPPRPKIFSISCIFFGNFGKTVQWCPCYGEPWIRFCLLLSLPNFKEYVFTNVDFFISKTLSRRGCKIWHQWQRQMTDKSRLHGLILAFCKINVLSLKQNTSSWFLLGFLFFFTPRQWSCGKVRLSLVCLFTGGPMWPLPMMHWASLYRDPSPKHTHTHRHDQTC